MPSSNSDNPKTEQLKSTDPARAPSIRGEKRVKPTDASVPVEPAPERGEAHDGPTDPAAVDQRKEFTGTDQPADAPPGESA